MTSHAFPSSERLLWDYLHDLVLFIKNRLGEFQLQFPPQPAGGQKSPDNAGCGQGVIVLYTHAGRAARQPPKGPCVKVDFPEDTEVRGDHEGRELRTETRSPAGSVSVRAVGAAGSRCL